MKINNYIKRKIFERMFRKYSFPCKLILGAGGDRYPGWLSTEKSFFDITNEEDWRKYFNVEVPVTTEQQIGEREEIIDGVKTTVKVQLDIPEEKIEYQKLQVISRMLADHVFQELTRDEAIKALIYARRYLTPGGRIRICVPDHNHKDKKFVKLMDRIYESKTKWDKDSLMSVMRLAGFKQFQIKETFDAGGLFNIQTWYRIDGYCKRSFWYDANNMVGDSGMFWSCLIIDAIKSRNSK